MYRLFVCVFLIALPVCVHANIASVTYVEGRTATQVKTVGDQQISGTKTYTASPVVPTPVLPSTSES